MLYIRADGNTDIGMGHVMRCMSVAEATAEIDCQYTTVFITADDGCRSMIEDRGFRVIVLNTDYKNMMSEIPQLETLFQEEQDISSIVLLVDSYQVSREYYLALKKLVKVACFEDMGQAYPVDLLINYNVYAPDLSQNYTVSQKDESIVDTYPDRILLGVEYMPLRKAFQKPADYAVHDKITNVTITTGGSDPYFATASLTDSLINDCFIKEQGIHFNLISGPFNKFADELKRRYQTCENITIYENVKDMRSLLLESDVVITATGSTIYEVSALGIPMIVFYFAENQRRGAMALEKLTDIVNAGGFAEDSMTVAEEVTDALKKCIRDKSYRELLNQQEKGLIDGKGALRVAGQLKEL